MAHKIILTGVSGGFGTLTAKTLIENGYQVRHERSF